MKFSIGQAELAGAVSWAAQSVSSRSTLPVLSNVLLRAEYDALTVASTNLETALALEVPANVADTGALTLPARLLKDTLSGIPDGAQIEFDVDYARMAATLVYRVGGKRRGQATIKGIDADEFPMLPDLAGPPALCFTGAELATLIRQSAFAAADAKDTSRPALTGVLWTADGARLTCAATDGYRLAVVTKDDAAFAGKLIIPARALALADKLAAVSESVEARVSEQGQLGLTFVGVKGFRSAQLTAQVIDAKFPDYNAIIPKAATTTVEVDTGEVLRALKMAALYARDNSDRVVLRAAPKMDAPAQLSITAQSTEAGNFETEIDALVAGTEIEASFNVTYLLDGLNALNEPTAKFEFTTGVRPCVLKGNGYQCVVMPMQLQK